MSTKTLRKRIALVAVSALTAGVFSVVSSPAANAANLFDDYVATGFCYAYFQLPNIGRQFYYIEAEK